MDKIISHPMYIYLSIPEYKLFSKNLISQGFYTESYTYHKYTAQYTYFENVYLISRKKFIKNIESTTLISKDVIRKGKQKGLMLLYIHWDEAESERGSLEKFLKLFNYKLAYLGSTPDWLGHPIYTLVNKENIIQRRKQLSYEKNT